MGHFHFWGPNYNFNSEQSRYCNGSASPWYGQFYKPGQHCVEGWDWNEETNQWVGVGLPCINL